MMGFPSFNPSYEYERPTSKETNESLQPDPPNRLHRHFRARHGGHAPLLWDGDGISAPAHAQRQMDRVPDRRQYAGARRPWRAVQRSAAATRRAVAADGVPRRAGHGGPMRRRA